MKKYVKTFLCLLICLVIFAGCGNKTDEAQNQTIFIGDNSKVVQLASNLPYPEGMGYDHIEIQSQNEPYELKVFVTTDEVKTAGLQECADKAFEKVHNMGIISFYNQENHQLIQSFHRK